MLKFSKSFLVIAIILLLTLLPFTVNAVDLNLSAIVVCSGRITIPASPRVTPVSFLRQA